MMINEHFLTLIIILLIIISFIIVLIIPHNEALDNNLKNNIDQKLEDWKNVVNLVALQGSSLNNFNINKLSQIHQIPQNFSTVSQNRFFKSKNNDDNSILQPIRTIVGPKDLSNIYISSGDVVKSINFTTENFPKYFQFKGFEVKISPYDDGIDPNNDSSYYYLSFKFNKWEDKDNVMSGSKNYIGDNSDYCCKAGKDKCEPTGKCSIGDGPSGPTTDLIDIRTTISTIFPDVYVINALPGTATDTDYSCLDFYGNISKCEIGNKFDSGDNRQTQDGYVYSSVTTYTPQSILFPLFSFSMLFEYLFVLFIGDIDGDILNQTKPTDDRKGTLVMLLRNFDQELRTNSTSTFCNELVPQCSNCCQDNEPPQMLDQCSNDNPQPCYTKGQGVYYIIAAASVKLPKDFKYKLTDLKYWQFNNLDDENSIIFNNILAM